MNVWFAVYILTLNASKNELMHLGCYIDNVLQDTSIVINSIPGKINEYTKYLGVFVDYNFKRNHHIQHVIKKTRFGFFLYELHLTKNTFAEIVDRKVLKNERKNVEYIYINITDRSGKRKKITLNQSGGYLQFNEKFPWLRNWWERQKQMLRWKLLAMATYGSMRDRCKSVEILSKLQLDSESDFVQLAQACDAATAVGLARSRNVDLRFFLPPRGLLVSKNKEVLVSHLRDLLFDLNEKNEHLCVKHFLSKAFPYFQEEYTNLDYSQLMPMEDTITLNISDENILPMSVKSLVHHCSIRDNAKDMVKKGGLALLLDVYKLAGNNKEINLMLGRLMTYVSRYPELLDQVFMSGWIGVLAKWAQDQDKALSVPAIQCLANFDFDDPLNARYGRRVFPLYPCTRSKLPKVDVVFVHGLLGGVLFTWRQRNSALTEEPLSFFDITFTGSDSEANSADNRKSTSDKNTQAYLSVMTELLATEWDEIGSDFEYVLTDLPVDTNMANNQTFSMSGKNQNVRRLGEDQSYTSCWPQDWLPQDCPSIRVIGVNYDSRLSDWLAVCPNKITAQSLDYRSKELLQQLKACGIGQRPVIWITHSMGGLLVKKMLVYASNSDNKVLKDIADKTKGIVFMGTPHKGSHLANINEILKRIILPSSEVEDLKHNSPMLRELHEHFLQYLNKVPVKVVSFAETKSTMLSSLRIEVHLVPADIAYPGTGEMYELPYDHACLAKPQNRLSFIYQKILSVVRSIVNEV